MLLTVDQTVSFMFRDRDCFCAFLFVSLGKGMRLFKVLSCLIYILKVNNYFKYI